MLTFFRKLRKSLMDSGSAKKYTLYAIGEIALVVVGILIALQINNYNENRKNRGQDLKHSHAERRRRNLIAAAALIRRMEIPLRRRISSVRFSDFVLCIAALRIVLFKASRLAAHFKMPENIFELSIKFC